MKKKNKNNGCLVCPNSMLMAGAGSLSTDSGNLMPSAIHGPQVGGECCESEKQVKKESSIDFPVSNGLCSDIWEQADDGNYVIKSEVKQRALKIVDMLSKHYHIHPVGVNVVGSICSNQYNDGSDIDIHIQVKMSSGAQEQLDNIFWFERRNGLLDGIDLMIGSHPLEFYYQSNIYADIGSCGCYDLMNDKWLSGPQIVDMEFNPYDEYEQSFDEAFEFGKRVQMALFGLHKNMYKYNAILDQASNEDVYSNEQMMNIVTHRIDDTIDVIKDNAREIDGLYNEMMQVRRRTGLKPTDKDSAEEMRTNKDWLIANSTYKFLQQLNVIGSCKEISNTFSLWDSDLISSETAIMRLNEELMGLNG